MKKPKINLTGEKFGKLTVIKEGKRNRKRAIWICKCNCGKTTTVPASHLKTGDTRSCGCLHME